MRLGFRDDGYTLRGTSVTGFIDIARSEGEPGPLKLVVDEEVLASRVSGVAYNIKPSRRRCTLPHDEPARPLRCRCSEGFKFDVAKSTENALKGIEGYTGGDKLQVDLEVAVVEPNLKDADLSTISTPDLLGTGQTSYAGSSAERAHNVGLGTRRIDGALIPPGGIFSTVDTIGACRWLAGFKMGYGSLRPRTVSPPCHQKRAASARSRQPCSTPCSGRACQLSSGTGTRTGSVLTGGHRVACWAWTPQ